MNSLIGRWFGTFKDENDDQRLLKRNIVVQIDSKFYKVTSVYLKSYNNKWRIEEAVKPIQTAKVHLTKVIFQRERSITVDHTCSRATKYLIAKGSDCTKIIGQITAQRPN